MAEKLTAAGHQVRVPSLLHVGADEPPFWPRIVNAVRGELGEIPTDRPLMLVAHRKAGLFLPSIRSGLNIPMTGSIFVDAALPARTGTTPVAAPELMEFLRPMSVNGTLPRWTDWWDEADIAPMFPDPEMRQKIIAAQPTLPLSY